MSSRKEKNRGGGGGLLPVLAGVVAGAAVVAASFFAADMIEEGAAKDRQKRQQQQAQKQQEEEELDDGKIMDTVCPICFYNYDDKKHAPMAFDCGHTAVQGLQRDRYLLRVPQTHYTEAQIVPYLIDDENETTTEMQNLTSP
eukprot:CAMPEP_0171500020 /NCGR_PEP_ID=MMETSP0958-20121227/8748_1 /TAXON_ID=87120 /ORGANISM="Aurantiochytrium limacinum, Strain ATCCMYA-1381" /LENGTH=141 /DNA_ID=CAMNT_0012034633 /DNA_START=99 /DNA_END=523 /DNA_ORIENTATION=+